MVGLWTIRLLVQVHRHWVQFTLERKGYDNHHGHNKPQTGNVAGVWMTSCPEEMGWEFEDFKNRFSWRLTLDHAGCKEVVIKITIGTSREISLVILLEWHLLPIPLLLLSQNMVRTVWIIDSTVSDHITYKKSHLFSYKRFDWPHKVILGDNSEIYPFWEKLQCDFGLGDDHIYQPLRSGRIWHQVNF